MRTKVQRWGNSLALRIPRALAAELSVSHDSVVELSLSRGRMLVQPIVDEAPELDELLAAITVDNCHQEIDWGSARGNESW